MDAQTRLTQLLSSTPIIPDYTQKWSVRGQQLYHNPMREEMKTVTSETTVLDIGQPNDTMSPITALTFELSGGEKVEVEKVILDKLAKYNSANGLPELKSFLLEIQRREHQPPQMVAGCQPSNFDLAVTCGITEALNWCVEAIIDDEDTILLQDITYSTFMLSLKTHGKTFRGVSFDDEGIVPEALEDTLKNWNQMHPGLRLPKLLYTVTFASNPMANNWTLERMLDVYSICRKYDILIMDDGAYHFLQFGERLRSFQSFDVDGRVIRFDSFSKIIGAGYRLGWVSGPAPIVDKINNKHEFTCAHTSVLTQAIIYSMLKKWGLDGFEKRVTTVAKFYEKKAEYAINACGKYLSRLATWTPPEGGMFMWIVLKNCDSAEDVVKKLKENYDIRVANGNMYRADSGVESRALRLCYSTASPDILEKAIKCLADVLRRKGAQEELNGFYQSTL